MFSLCSAPASFSHYVLYSLPCYSPLSQIALYKPSLRSILSILLFLLWTLQMFLIFTTKTFPLTIPWSSSLSVYTGTWSSCMENLGHYTLKLTVAMIIRLELSTLPLKEGGLKPCPPSEFIAVNDWWVWWFEYGPWEVALSGGMALLGKSVQDLPREEERPLQAA